MQQLLYPGEGVLESFAVLLWRCFYKLLYVLAHLLKRAIALRLPNLTLLIF